MGCDCKCHGTRGYPVPWNECCEDCCSTHHDVSWPPPPVPDPESD